MMPAKDRIVKQIKCIVDPKRLLTSREDLYVYSFEKIFEDPKYFNFDVVIKAASKDEIAQIEKLAEEEEFIVVQRGRDAIIHEPDQSKGRGSILLDAALPPDIVAFDERLHKKVEEAKDARRRLMGAMGGSGRSYKKMASAMESLFLDKMILQCRDCDICTGYCTVSPCFNHVETWSAKGRYLLTKGFMKGDLQQSERLADILYSCTLCGLCYTQCIRNPHLREAILDVRGKMAEASLAPEFAQIALRNIIERGNPMGSPTDLRTRWMEKLPKNLLKEGADILYWAGCNTTLRSAVRATAVATVHVLNKADVKVMTLGQKEMCCGIPLVFGGLFKDAKRNAEEVVKEIEEANVETLVASCSGCYETFINFYPKKLDVEMPCEVLHTSQLVERLVKGGRLAPNDLGIRVSYHDPCGLGRHCGVYDPPRKLLMSIPSLWLIEPTFTRDRSRCCGGGGGFWEFNSKASMSLAHLRIMEDIMPLNVNALAVACPLCHINFLYTSARHSLGIKIYDIMQIMEMALRKER